MADHDFHKPVLLGGLADEAANQKTAMQQFCAFAALGLRYYTLRFIDAGAGIQNVMQLEPAAIEHILALQREYGLSVSSIGSPIGKVKLIHAEDGTTNRYVPFEEYLARDVRRACELANTFDCKLIRGFSFYHPRGSEPETHLQQAIDQIGEIVHVCDQYGLTYGLEVEANLVGQTGKLLAKIHDAVANPALVLVFDGANLVCQGMSTDQVFEEYQAMKPGMGWIHVKDYKRPAVRASHVDEESLSAFVPADLGDCGHEAIFRDIKRSYAEIHQRLSQRGLPGLFVDLEPHVKGGGQFGGFSGPDGFGVALRGLCKVLDYVGLPYYLRDFGDIRPESASSSH
ncbi:MAG: sugar phosphate isomerase/epimerase [Planctomycetes bacterium]|nr:sugar phosphate isomerase/epimerase [Planctomycetota bacterium]